MPSGVRQAYGKAGIIREVANDAGRKSVGASSAGTYRGSSVEELVV